MSFRGKDMFICANFFAHTQNEKCPQVLGDPLTPPSSVSKVRFVRISKIQMYGSSFQTYGTKIQIPSAQNQIYGAQIRIFDPELK